MGITEAYEIDKADALRGALKMIIDHAYNHLVRLDHQPYRNGIAAYDAWIAAFTARTVEAFGNAYNVGVVSDAREFAAEFLRRLAGKWDGESLTEREVSRLAGLAAQHYWQVAQALAQIRTMFPFPQGGTPNDEEQARAAISLLHEARTAEEQGVGKLVEMLNVLEQP